MLFILYFKILKPSSRKLANGFSRDELETIDELKSKLEFIMLLGNWKWNAFSHVVGNDIHFMILNVSLALHDWSEYHNASDYGRRLESFCNNDIADYKMIEVSLCIIHLDDSMDYGSSVVHGPICILKFLQYGLWFFNISLWNRCKHR